MPEALPEPPPDRTGWWRGESTPHNPDLTPPPAAARPVSANTITVICALIVFGALAVVVVGSSGSGSAAGTLVPLFVIGVPVAIAAVIGWSLLSSYRQSRREREQKQALAAWAVSKGLRYSASGDLPEATPLLERGDSRSSSNLISGELPGGLPGVLANYTYVTKRGEDDQGEPHPNTVVVARLPETLGFLGELWVEPHERLGLGDRFQELARRRRRVSQESSELAQHFDVCIGRDRDDVWVHRLFTPAFIEWLATQAPKGLTFELREGIICVAIGRKVVDPGYLEAFCRTASYIASRLRSEGLEAVRMPASARFAAKPAVVVVSAHLAQVDFSASTPSDATVAARPFRPIVTRDAATWARPLLYGAIALVAAAAWAADDVGGHPRPTVIGVVVGVLVFALTARFEIASRSQKLGKEAFLREYGRAHNLVMEEPRSFHARQASANLPGAAEHVLTGQLRPLGLAASLVLCRDQARGSKDIEYEALVLPSGAERTATLRVPPGAPPPPSLGADATELLGRTDGVGPLGIGREGGTLVIYAERRRKTPVSVAELDLFIRRAKPVVERMRALAAHGPVSAPDEAGGGTRFASADTSGEANDPAV